MLSPVAGATVESDLLEVFKIAQVESFQQTLIFTLQIRRLDHISHVKDKELQAVGLLSPQIRSLRSAVSELQKREFRRNAEPQQVYIRNENVIDYGTADPNKALIPITQIKLMETIGEGTFSVVKRAIWYHPNGGKLDVAVKILREVSESIMEDLQVEASHLLKLQHSNLIRLYGVVQKPAMMVFELCEGGELLTRLRDTTKPVPLVTTLLDYCLQVVKALTFLESKQYVHRDVAARNILISKDEKVVKLCDFGLMRGLKENERTYVMQSQNRVPFSWCPPEALRHRKFSHASDVWAFGVTAWEIFSYGEDPWIGCRAIDVLKRLDAGERLEKPRYCSQQIYDLIGLCWNIDPDLRPKFSMLRKLLLEAKFNIAEVRDAMQPEQGDNMLQMMPRDKIIIIENNGLLWYGQSERTRKFGNLLRSAVFVYGKSMVNNSQKDTCSPVGNSKISLPIRGSFIHAAHGDVFGGESWGTPEKIDEIYLKNPVVGNPLDFTMNGVSIIARSIAGSSIASLPTPNVICRPSTSKESSDPFRTDWDEAFDVASFDDYFSTNKIKLDNIHTKVKESGIVPRPSSTPIVFPSSFAGKQRDDEDTSSLKRPRTAARMDYQVQSNISSIANVMNELSAEIAIRRESANVRPVLHNEQRVLFSETGLTLAGSDPFEISDFVKKAVHNERYNDILEKKADETKVALLPPLPLNTMKSKPHNVNNDVQAGPSVMSRPNALVGNSTSSSFGFIRGQTNQQPVLNRQPETNQEFRPGTKCGGKGHQPSSTGVKNTNQPNFTQNLNTVIHFHDSKHSEALQDKVTSKKPTDSFATELHTSNEPSAEMKSRPAISNSFLDESRRSRVESEISKVLPPPSELFFGKLGSVTDHSSSLLEPKNEGSSGTSSQQMPKVTPHLPELSLHGVLEPIRLPINIPSPEPHPAAVTQSTHQFLKDLSVLDSSNSIMSQPVNQRQLPLFSLSNNPVMTSDIRGRRFGMVMPKFPYNYYGTSTASCSNSEQYGNGSLPPKLGPCVPFKIGEGQDLLEMLDPLSSYSRMGRTRGTPSSTQESPITRAEQMEILYADAPFASHSRCDEMVAKCRGSIACALQELKIEHLVEAQIASSKEIAKEALDARGWNLNAAAELLLSNTPNSSV